MMVHTIDPRIDLTGVHGDQSKPKTIFNDGRDDGDPVWTRIKTLELNLEMLRSQAENKKMMKRIKNFHKEIDNVCISLVTIESEINKLSQCGRRECIEIIGIPTEKDARLEETVIKVLNKIGVDIDPYQLVAVRRVNEDSDNKYPSVIVKLLN